MESDIILDVKQIKKSKIESRIKDMNILGILVVGFFIIGILAYIIARIFYNYSFI